MGALECRTEPAVKLESTCEEQAPEGAGEEQAPEGAGEEQAPEGLREPRTAADFPRRQAGRARGRRRRNPANGRPRSAAGGGGAPPSFRSVNLSQSCCGGRTRETRGKRNNGNLMTAHTGYTTNRRVDGKTQGKLRAYET